MRPALIAIVGIAGLIGVFLFELYLPLVLFAVNGLTLCLILTGTLVPVKSRIGRIALGLPEGFSSSDESLWPCIEGKKLDPNLPRPLEFHTESRGISPLLLLGTLSLSAMASALWVHPSLLTVCDVDSSSFLPLFLAVFLSFVPLSIAVSWLLERVLLLRAAVTLGLLDSRSGGYNFKDHNGASYGGIKKVLPINRADNMCLVFYWPSKADFNKPSAALWFHRLVVH